MQKFRFKKDLYVIGRTILGKINITIFKRYNHNINNCNINNNINNNKLYNIKK